MLSGKKRIGLIVFLSMLLILSSALFAEGKQEKSGSEKETYEWRFGHEEVENGCMDLFAQRFKELLSEKSNGRINVEIFPAQSIGSSPDMIELVQDGVLEFNIASSGWAGSLVPQVQVFLLDYVFPKDLEVTLDVLNNGNAIKLVNDSFREKMIEPLTHLTEGWNAWTSNKPLRTPDDFEGFKMRVMASPILIKTYAAYGANPTATDFSEVYSSLQLGVIDGQVNPILVIEDMGFYEVQKYIVKSYSNPFVGTLITNLEFYNSLPTDIKQILDDTVEEMIAEGYKIQKKLNDERIDKMLKAKPSLEVLELTDREIETFRKLSIPVRSTFVSEGGKNAQKILDMMLKDIEEAE